MNRLIMVSLLCVAGCGRMFDVGDDSKNKGGLQPGGQCGPVCAIACEFGNVLDANGCPTCACNPPPVSCGNTWCPQGQECCNPSCGICVPPGGACTQQACNPACNPVACTLACEYGFQRGPDGCEICACNPPPTQLPDAGQCGPVCAIYCEHGNVLDANGCPTCACNPAPDSGRTCGPVCAIYCEYGNQLGPDGCPMCACNPPPGGTTDAGAPTQCGATVCQPGTECCNASCGTCVPPGFACTQEACACAPVVCTLACQYGFQRGADGCEICACAPPPQSCGNVTCGAGLECCNASCGICVPPGNACIQIACN